MDLRKIRIKYSGKKDHVQSDGFKFCALELFSAAVEPVRTLPRRRQLVTQYVRGSMNIGSQRNYTWEHAFK